MIIKKILFFILLVILIIAVGKKAETDHNEYYMAKSVDLQTANSHARFIYSGAASYLDYINQNTDKAFDGAFCGSLIYDKSESEKYDVLLNHCEDIETALRCLYGGSTEEYGYYYLLIENNTVIRSYWSDSAVLLSYADKLNTEEHDGTVYIGGAVCGGYPVSVTDHHTKEPPYSELHNAAEQSYNENISEKEAAARIKRYVLYYSLLLLIIGPIFEIFFKVKKQTIIDNL
ncbi:MAG: hypothetical protein IJ446_10110 [Oscillospiraceae bacterium]|nr:hypothetical protein [Oscillospiraceae bacterium]